MTARRGSPEIDVSSSSNFVSRRIGPESPFGSVPEILVPPKMSSLNESFHASNIFGVMKPLIRVPSISSLRGARPRRTAQALMGTHARARGRTF